MLRYYHRVNKLSTENVKKIKIVTVLTEFMYKYTYIHEYTHNFEYFADSNL